MTRCVHVQCSYTRNGLINNMAQATICMDVQCSYTDTQRINGLLCGFLLRWMFVPCTHTLSLSLLQVKNWYVVLNGQMKLQRDSDGDKIYHVGDS